MSKFLQQIFSVKNEDCHKTLTILGIKVKFKRKKNKIADIINCTNNLIGNLDDLNEFRFYQAVNKTKEAALKAKIRETHKCRVLFILTHMAKFGMETVYKAMEESDLFEPEILICAADNGFKEEQGEQWWQDALESYKLFKSYGYKTTFAYDMNQKKPVDIQDFKPDIVFFNDPNLHKVSYFKNQLLNFNFLTCYIPYGCDMVNSFEYHYEHKPSVQAWKYFFPHRFGFNISCNLSKYKGLNAVLTGYPKLDEYEKEYYEIPEKINNNKKTIIYAPHWSITTVNSNPNLNRNIDESRANSSLSTFWYYAGLFSELREKYQDINWVFKPHPNLVYSIIGQKNDPDIMSYEEYMKYIKNWDEAPNGVYLNSFEYINLFKHSDLLITDCGSFVGEWLPSKHPCIYLLNPKSGNWRNNYNSLANKILDTYYLCRNKEEILENFEKIILNNIDEKKDTRLKILDEEFDYIGCAGEKIVEYLESVLT